MKLKKIRLEVCGIRDLAIDHECKNKTFSMKNIYYISLKTSVMQYFINCICICSTIGTMK